MKIEAKRTPDSQFENLPGYPFSPNYATVQGDLRIHYIDENSDSNDVVLLLHGEPSWSYLYRKMVPVYIEAGYRVIVPDLIGFGKSDKPLKQSDYTYQKHVDWIKQLLFDILNLENIHLFCQDWGGLIGLRLLAEHPERFKTATAGNTFLPTGSQPPNDDFLKWQSFSKKANPFPVGMVLQNATVNQLSADIIAAYDAPYPDESYKAGAKIFPSLVPTSLDDPASTPNQKAWSVLSKMEKPFLTLFSDKDPITKGLEKLFHNLIPGCKGQPHSTIEDAGHFLQEDKGEEIATKMVAWLESLK